MSLSGLLQNGSLQQPRFLFTKFWFIVLLVSVHVGATLAVARWYLLAMIAGDREGRPYADVPKTLAFA